ncbi:unnamed protein product [Lymnaea stagnalis]|uniref:Spondin-like TSP1 domain-containing protein n=1 Tax=Lymnaea stagnalis TaxID=6523 RepID=A0AAV2H4T7_LYMST
MDYRSVVRIGGFQPGAILVILALWIPHSVSHLQFKWSVGAWGECEHEGCGPGGRQFRDVWCTLQTGHPVLNANCEEEFKPAVRRECTRPCSQDVVLDNPEVYDKNREPYSPEYNDYENSRRGHVGGKLGPDRDDPAESVGIGSEYDGFGGRDFRPGWYPQDSNPREPPRLPITSATSDVEWVVSQWSSCKLESGTKACGRNSGLRHRNVTCERRDSQMTVAMARCLLDEPMPSTQESCELLCRQDCVVSEYSELSGCDSTCQLTNQTRTRVVIVPPRHRGSHCPDLSEMYSCENCSNSYTYQFSPWLPCISIEGSYSMNAHPLIGYQTREISCLQSKGVLTSLRHCTDKLPFTNLKKHRACVMAQDCQVSDWSPLVPHNSSCIGYDGIIQHGYMVRTRQVLQLPMGNGDPCPSKLVDYIRLNKEDIKALRSCKK